MRHGVGEKRWRREASGRLEGGGWRVEVGGNCLKPQTSSLKQAGFTLLEILVALAILGIALTLVLELFAGGLRLLGRSEESLRAAQLAAQKLEEVLMRQEAAVSERVEQGVFPDGTRWLVRVVPVPSPEATNLSAALPWDMQEYTVRVTWSSGLRERSYDLYANKLVQKGQQVR